MARTLQTTVMEDGGQQPTSLVLLGILTEARQSNVPAEWFIQKLKGRAFGALLLVLGALALIPGIATLAGLLMIPPALQMALGRPTPALPGVIRKLSVPSAWLSGRSAQGAVLSVTQLERVVRPRLGVLVRPPFVNLAGLLVFCLALAILAPLPLLHMIPAFVVMIIAVAILERDGLTMMAGLTLGALTVMGGALLWHTIFQTAERLWST